MSKHKKTPTASEVLKPLIHSDDNTPPKKVSLTKRYTIFYGLILLIMLYIYLSAEAMNGVYHVTAENLMPITLYFINPSQNSLRTEHRNIETPASNRELINAVLTELISKGPRNANNSRIHPKDSVIVESAWYLEQDKACGVLLTDSYAALSLSEQLLIRAAVATTLTELNFIDGVIFYSPSGELTNALGMPLGMHTRESMSLDPPLSPLRVNTRTITLYFADTDGELLVPEARTVEMLGNVEYHIVEQLIKGPFQEDTEPLLASDLTIKSATTTDGICYVDFSANFVSRHLMGDGRGNLAVYSIVNSLTELSSVQKVQIIADSAVITEIINGLDLSIPLTRNEAWIK